MANPNPLPEIVLGEIYSWSGARFHKYLLVRRGILYSFKPLAGAPTVDELLRPISRLVLYPTESRIPLVVDTRTFVDGDDETLSFIRIRDSQRSAEIKFGVRTVWYRFHRLLVVDRELIAFEIKLEFSQLRGDYKSFTSSDLRGDDERLIRDYEPRLSRLLANPVPHLFDEPEDSLKISKEGVGIRWDRKVHSELSFQPQPPKPQPTAFYRLEFKAQLTAETKDEAQILRGFNQSFIANRFNRGFKADKDFPDADELIAFEAREPIPANWIGHQIPTEDLRPDQPPKIVDGLPRTEWIVLIEGIPSLKAVNVWNAVAKSFHSGLHTVKAGNRVSFLPLLDPLSSDPNSCTWVAGYFLRDAFAIDPDYRIDGRGDCPENPSKCATLTAFSIWPLDTCSISATFPGLFDEARNNISGTLRISKPTDRFLGKFIGQPGLRIEATELTFPSETSIRLGALDLHVAPVGTPAATNIGGSFFDLQFERNAKSSLMEERQLNLSLETAINLIQVLPGGEDAASSSEFKTQGRPSIFERDRPLIIPWGKQNAPNNFLFLKIFEEAGKEPRTETEPEKEFSDTVKIELRNQRNDQVFEQKLIVIDPDPFTIVAVKFLSFESQGDANTTNIIASWSNNGAKWQLKTLADHFSMVLPPQVLGEEMEKHRTIPRGAPINFRLSQPTSMELRAATFRQNFTEPPWNLRRILEPEDPQASGANILFMQYELLYGLSCNFKTTDTEVKNLRLMELFRRFGRIPGAFRNKPAGTGGREAEEQWTKLFRQYRARVGVFVPWESIEDKSLIINKGIQCSIRRNGNRDGANLAYPYDLFGEPGVEDLEDPGTTQRYSQPLRGGAVWGFESRNIFTAVMRPNPVTGVIESNTARLSDPEFSSLGGWGHVSATFDNNRSKIYGDTAMGRTFSYTLERIGRIGCFWNIAKHVIVYERHVANSQQFVCQQDELSGLPILRKTHEYIEILEPKRTYPENPSAPAMQPGFVDSCHFTKGQRINVDSLWGSDVGTEGWKVPLWNPSARQDVYPKPVFSVGLKADVAGTEGTCPGQIDNPENVFFYTSTNPKLKADPNIWDAVLDVDFVNLPLAEPAEGEYPNGAFVRVMPPDPPVASGFQPCTFRIVKPASPINLVANRSDKPLSTILQNVTVMRAGALDIKPTANDAFSHLHNLQKNAANIYAELFKTLPEKATKSISEIKSDLAAAIDRQQANIDRLRGQIAEVKSQVDKAQSLFKQRIFDREKEILDSFGQRLLGFTDDIKKEYQSTLDALLAISPTPADLKSRVTKAVDNLFQKTIDTIFVVPVASGILRRVVEQFQHTLEDYASRYEKLWDDFDQQVTAVTADKRAMLEALLATTDAEIRVLRSRLENFKPWFPEAWIPDPQPVRAHLQRALGSLSGYENKITELNALLRDAASTAAQIKAKANEIKQLVTGGFADPINQIKLLLNDEVQSKVRKAIVLLLVDEAALVKTVVDPLHPDTRVLSWTIDPTKCPASPTGVYCKLRGKIAATDVSQLRKSITDLESFLSKDTINAAIKDLKIRVIDSEEATNLTTLVGAFVASTAVPQFFRELQDLFEHFNPAVPATSIKKAVSDAMDAIAGQPQKAFEELDKLRKGVLEKANRAFEDDFRPLQEAAKPVFQSADSALRLVRAFGAPPSVPNLTFDRPEVAFFYKEAQRVVDITPVLSRVNQAQEIAGAAADSLNALGIKLPTKQLFNDLIPKPLEDFDLRKIFPDFAGLKLENLLPGLKMPSIANDRVRVSHGIDPQTRRAWVQAVVDNVQITTPTKLFTIGPVELAVPKSSFSALTRFEGAIGETPKRQINAKITGDWDVKIGGQSIVVFKDTQLTYDDAAGLKFRIEPSHIQLSGILTFISEVVSKFGGKDSGLSFGLLPDGGIQCVLSLPLPDMQIGAVGISHLNLGALLALRLQDPRMDNNFSIELGFNLGRKLAPFALTVFLLGGGGYLELSTRYAPSTGKLKCFVFLGITAGAALSISLGPIHGGVFIFFGITAEFEAGGGARFAIGVMLLIRGEVSLLGIVEACICLLLEAQYDTTSGQLIGHGKLSISIEICWCFTLEISEEVTYTVGEGSKGNAQRHLPADLRRESHHARRAALPAPADYLGLVNDYLNMLA